MEEKEKPKETKYNLFKGFNCSECRTYEYPVSTIYQTMIDCTKFHEWWPKSFTSKVELCKPEIIGSIIDFTSDWGNYSAEISQIKENEQMAIDYNKGILQGSQVWRVKELESVTDASGNVIPKTEVCYDAEIYPTTKKLQLFTSFLSDASKRSYFSPLLDSLETRMVYVAAEDKRIREEQVLQKQIQEQHLTILQEEDQQIEELKSIQLQLNQVQTQVQQYMARLEAQKEQRQRLQFARVQPVAVGTNQPPSPPPPAPAPVPTPAPLEPVNMEPVSSSPSSGSDSMPPPPEIPSFVPPTPSTPETPPPAAPPASALQSFFAPSPFGPALAHVLNPSFVAAVTKSANSSMDEPFSQVGLQEPRSRIQQLKQIDITSIEEPIFVVPVSKPELSD